MKSFSLSLPIRGNQGLTFPKNARQMSLPQTTKTGTKPKTQRNKQLYLYTVFYGKSNYQLVRRF